MIRVWISRTTEVPIPEQLASQILLGILSGRIAAGEKLPSVREWARRLKIHSNTVSAAYSDLARRGWVESRRGSGVYASRETEFPATSGPSRRMLVCDPDPELARILAAEVEEAAGSPVHYAGSDTAIQLLEPGTRVFASSGQAANVARGLGGVAVEVLHLRSLPELIASARRPAGPALIAIVSRSPSVREWAATLVAALGIDADTVLIRDPALPGWQDGLGACAVAGADVISAKLLPSTVPPFVIRLLSDASLAALRKVSHDAA